MTRRVIRQSIVWFVVLAASLFIPAGTLAWLGAWVYLAEIAVTGSVITLWMLRNDPALLAERMPPLIQRDQKTWDKALISALMVLWCCWFALLGLDAVRYAWSTVTVWLQALGAVAIIVGMHVVFLTVRANSFAAPVLKIQADRQPRTLCYRAASNVCGRARHGHRDAALLGSWWGLATAPVLVLLLAGRAVMEERTLMRELASYADYATRVRYRLVPLIW